MRGMALAFARRPQPLTVALADTHPGNFIVDRSGLAWFVDLEKVHVGSPAIDLAHATLATSTLWHPDVGKVLSRAEVQGFYALYLEKVGKKQAALRCSHGSSRCAGSPGSEPRFSWRAGGCRHAARAIRRTPHNGATPASSRR